VSETETEMKDEERDALDALLLHFGCTSEQLLSRRVAQISREVRMLPCPLELKGGLEQ